MAPQAAQRQRPRHEPLFDVHRQTGVSFEVFYADRALETFGRCGPGWYWWFRWPGFAPDGQATGPFGTGYGAFRHALGTALGTNSNAGLKSSTLLIEESPISHGLIQSLQESRINVVTVRPDRDKQSRVISQSDLFEGGSVFFPEKAPWLEDLENELLAFPGRHDDQVDALIQGLAWQRERFGLPQSRTIVG